MEKDKPKKHRILLNRIKGIKYVTDDEILEEFGEEALEELSNNKGCDEDDIH